MPQEHHEKCVDEILDGSLLVLDLCNFEKEALLQTKESVHELQSIFRSRGCSEIGLTSEVKKYLISRKAVKNAIHKALKGMQNKCAFSTSDHDDEIATIFAMLKEVEAVSVNVLESLLLFTFGPKAKPARWSLVSKLVHHKKPDANEFRQVDAALLALVEHKQCKSDNILHIENAQNKQHKLEQCIQDLEDCLEFLFRHLIITRVSLLDVPNH